MKLKDYCKDRVTRLLGTLVVLFILSEFLYIVGNTFASIFLIDLTIISILFIKNLIEWYRRKEYFKTIRERVEGDEKWLIFLISQILLNSVKYRRKEDAKIILSSEKKSKKVILKIWDNGTGIKEEELPRIFE